MKLKIALLGCLLHLVTVGSAQVMNDYQIAPLDMIIVDVFNEKELSKEFRVSASGAISFPLLGAVAAAGLTTEQLETKLRELLEKDYLVNPHVLVKVKDYRKRMISVLGEVTEPGQFELPGEQRMDVVEAISKAKGFTKIADKRRIRVTRNGKQQTFKLDDLLKKGNKPFYLEAGDIVFVEQSWL